MVRVEEAEKIILQECKDFGTESISFENCLGRVLAEDDPIEGLELVRDPQVSGGLGHVSFAGNGGSLSGDALGGRHLLLEVGVDPVHLGAQLLAHDLHLMPGLFRAHALEVLLARAVLGDPLACEVAALDL